MLTQEPRLVSFDCELRKYENLISIDVLAERGVLCARGGRCFNLSFYVSYYYISYSIIIAHATVQSIPKFPLNFAFR